MISATWFPIGDLPDLFQKRRRPGTSQNEPFHTWVLSGYSLTFHVFLDPVVQEKLPGLQPAQELVTRLQKEAAADAEKDRLIWFSVRIRMFRNAWTQWLLEKIDQIYSDFKLETKHKYFPNNWSVDSSIYTTRHWRFKSPNQQAKMPQCRMVGVRKRWLQTCIAKTGWSGVLFLRL